MIDSERIWTSRISNTMVAGWRLVSLIIYWKQTDKEEKRNRKSEVKIHWPVKCSSSSKDPLGILSHCMHVGILEIGRSTWHLVDQTFDEHTFESDTAILVRIDGSKGLGYRCFIRVLFRMVGIKFFQSNVTILILEKERSGIESRLRVLRDRDDRIPIEDHRLSHYCSTTSFALSLFVSLVWDEEGIWKREKLVVVHCMSCVLLMR